MSLVLGLGLEHIPVLGFKRVCPRKGCPWTWPRALCPRLHLCLVGCMLLGRNHLFFLTVPTKVMFQEFNTFANSIVVKKLSVTTFLPEPLYKLIRLELFARLRLFVGDHLLVFQCKSDLAVGMCLMHRKPRKP